MRDDATRSPLMLHRVKMAEALTRIHVSGRPTRPDRNALQNVQNCQVARLGSGAHIRRTVSVVVGSFAVRIALWRLDLNDDSVFSDSI